MSRRTNIPILDLKPQHRLMKKEFSRSIARCFDSQAWILGPAVSEFEANVAKYLGVRYALGVASGTDALILSLRALALRLKKKPHFDKEDEIITTPFTFIATAEAIVRAGARPVFVDVSPYTFNIDAEKIKSAVNRSTVGILPVHLYGLTCDMDKIKSLAVKNGLFIVEDAAQSFGAEYNGRKSGALGDCGAFSFFPSKNLGAWGDGGLVATNNRALARNIRILRNHGQSKTYNADYIGYNSRLDSIQAAVLSVRLKYLDKFNDMRREIAARYNRAFIKIPQIQVPSQPSGTHHVYHLYTIVARNKRDLFLAYLNKKGISARVYYPVTLPKMKAFNDYSPAGGLQDAEILTRGVISLPIYPLMKEADIKRVIRTVCEFF